MDIRLAGPADVGSLARLLWLHAGSGEQALQSAEVFAEDLGEWWTNHPSHVAFLAGPADSQDVGMAWLAVIPRVPRPGLTTRCSADIQSVFVLPEHRGLGVGSALVQVAAAHAERLGAGRVTVHSGRRAVPVYERLGFASSRQLLQRPPDDVRHDWTTLTD